MSKVRETAKRCHAIVSINIYDGPIDKLHNATVVIGRDGEPCYTYLKQHLPEGETAGARVDDGYTYEYRPLSVAEIEGVRYGFLTCYDAYFNEFIANMARHDLDVILYPSHQRGETSHILDMEARNIAFNCNAFVIRSSVSMGEDSKCGANTMVVAPDGSVIDCIGQKVGVLICEIDPKAKHDHCNGYGYEDIPTQEFVERRRRPWAYRAAGPATVPGDKDTAYPRACSHRGFNTFAP
jgi:predicted amidohydrolase